MARLLRSFYIKRPFLFSQVNRHESLIPSFQLCNFSTKGKKKSKPSDSSDENLSKKDLALQQAMDQITDSFGKGAIMWLGRSESPKEVPVISTGSFSLDLALGIGGLPKGRVVEIYGQEATGKTTLALHVIAEAQKSGGYCAFVDAEHALDPSLAEVIGVKTKNLLLSQPDSGEQALSLVDTLIRSGSVDVVVVDSVAALVPKSELDGEMGDAHMALQARLMSQALRKLCHSLSLSQTILIFINQVRCKLNTFGFGGLTEVTSGGNALKFYASVRLNIRRVAFVKKGDEIVGNQIMVKIVKNKHAPPFRSAQFELEFGKGICLASELIDHGLQHKFITRAGGFYYMNEKTYRKDALKLYLSNDDEARDQLTTKLREVLSPTIARGKPNNTDEEDGLEEIVETSYTSTDDEIPVAAVEA
ncbi:hypothetical protein KSP39_PZI011247 [Platanthera zijinensis]|uniref:Bacterial recombinase A n=1 Tax=Platanthera zijinensis TaxID=2320716 RepID=A0AAP0BID3_9ASPA